MPTRALSGTTALLTGVARDQARLGELRAQLGGAFTPVAADAARQGIVIPALAGVRRPAAPGIVATTAATSEEH